LQETDDNCCWNKSNVMHVIRISGITCHRLCTHLTFQDTGVIVHTVAFKI
jgi:hypothetical protein